MIRKWFRFSLTTLFALVTIVALILTFELNWIRQRREFVEAEKAIHQQRDVAMAILNTYPTEPKPRAPSLLWLFGEEGHANVYVLGQELDSQKCTVSDMERLHTAKELFPEATVYLANEHPKNGPNSFFGRVAPHEPDVP
jgi:hypothetical protein